MNCNRALELAKRIRKAEMVKGVNRPDCLTRRNNRLLYIRVWDYSTTLHAPAVQVIWTWSSGGAGLMDVELRHLSECP
jgi:hypothetical protein